MATRTFGYLKWECERCHREVIVEDVEVNPVRMSFDVRCPVCEKLVRFLMPNLRTLDALPPGETMPVALSGATPDEVH